MEFKNGVCRYDLKDVESLLLSKGDHYKEYFETFKRASNGENMGKPMYVVVETNNYCNMRCKMCIRAMDENQNDSHELSPELLDKLLSDIEKMDVPSVFLGGGAECLINPHIMEIITKIRKLKRTVTDDVLITNGYELSDEIIDLLIKEGWEKIFISLDAAKPETYKAIRGRDLLHVEERIRRLVERKKELNSVFPILRVSFVVMNTNKDEQEEFYDKWKDVVDIIDFQKLIVYSHDMAVKKNLPEPVEVCKQPFSRMEVDCFGNIYPCCSEWQKYLRIGNMADMSLEEAWNSPLIEQLRKVTAEKTCDICRTCMHSD
ncbi:MAG: radical SAM protein [Lachnospiraceae bacterium]|nr:radical SAM protein [Lachnospiraceae bacterium]